MSSNPSSQSVRANFRIRALQVRLIGSAGEQIGIVATKDALIRAKDEGLDLVEVSPNSDPPVCRILDLGKYLYTLGKKEKESRKKQKFVIVKEVKLSSKIGEHDFQTKLRQARRFLERGDKVKLTLFFRGREMMHTDIGQRVMQRFVEELSDSGEVERNEGLEGRALHMYLAPIVGQKKQSVKSAGNAGAKNEAKPEPKPTVEPKPAENTEQKDQNYAENENQ